METFKLEVYAYPINNNDWEKRHSFYFDAEKFEMEKHSDDGYFTVKVTAPKLPYEHYKRNNGAYGCRRAEQSIIDYAHIEHTHSLQYNALNLKEFGDKRGASALLILLMTVHPYTSTPHILDMYLNKIIY